MAKQLGPSDYGLYVQFAAFAIALVPLATAGFASWVQPLAASEGHGSAASAVIPIFLVIGLPMTLGCAYILGVLFSAQFWLIAAILFVEMLLYPLWSSLTLVFLTCHELRHYFVSSTAVPLLKLLGTVAAFHFYGSNLQVWGISLLLLGTGGLFVTAFVARAGGLPRGLRVTRLWLRRGYGFAAVGLSSSATDSVDKIVVSLVGGQAAAGLYGVAARFSAYGVIPVRAVALVAYPQYFQLAQKADYDGLRKLMYATIRKSAILGLGSAFLTVSGLIVASFTFLEEYSQSWFLGLILACVIPLRAVQYAAGDVTYALGRPSGRLVITLVGGALTAILVWFGFAWLGMTGAAAAVLGAAVVVSALLVTHVEVVMRKSSRKDGAQNAVLHSDRQRVGTSRG